MGFVRCFVYLAAVGCLSFVVGRLVPKFLFRAEKFPYRAFSFEKDGDIYENIRIKSWQNKLPDMSKLFSSFMPRKAVEEESAVAFKRMIEETCVAELVHACLIFVGFVCVALWKGIGGIIVSFLFAVGNIPFILIQRYNRPKLVRIYKKQLRREAKCLYPGGVLILSCNTGGGHNSCAKALSDKYIQNNEKCIIKDALAFVSEDFSAFVSRWHTRIYRHFPALFSFGYSFCEKHPSVMKKDGFISSLFIRGSEDLSVFIKNGGFHTVICTHLFAANMLSDAVNHYDLSCKTAFIDTDYTCSPSTDCADTDIFFLPANQIDRTLIKAKEIVVSGIPVRDSFYSFSEKRDTFSAGKIHALLMNGSMGCGDITKLASRLAQINGDFCITVVCGTNNKLKKRLDKRFKNMHNIRVLGYVHDMSALMDTADILITKPGGVTTTEACVKKLPMLFINAVGGCESYNLEYFVSCGAAISADSVSEAVRICEMLCAVPDILTDMKDNMPDMSVPASEIIIKSMSLQKEQSYANAQ